GGRGGRALATPVRRRRQRQLHPRAASVRAATALPRSPTSPTGFRQAFGRRLDSCGVADNEPGTNGRMTIATGIELPEAAIADICRRHQIKELSLFGSAARGEIRPDSDFDFLVDFLPGA